MKEIMAESVPRTVIESAEALEYTVEEARALLDLIEDNEVTEFLAGAIDKAQGDVHSGQHEAACVLLHIVKGE
jgi:hypothetical protein